MKVAIMGCGPAGSYLYTLLRRKKPDVEAVLFDTPESSACGIKGCAWGVSWKQFSKLCLDVGLNAHKYVFKIYNFVLFNDVKIKANVAIMDKPSFIKDLLAGGPCYSPSEAKLERFDRIIDATGAKRVYLKPCPNQPIAAFQSRVTLKESANSPSVEGFRNGNYIWVFPLGGNEAHLGAISSSAELAWREVNKVKEELGITEVKCSCSGKIWRHGPVRQFTEGKVWGLGEAVGLVDPITGGGIVPALTSAKLMVENWNNAAKYEEQVFRSYGYMVDEAKKVARVRAGERLSSRELFLPGCVFRTIGLSANLFQRIRFMRTTRSIVRPK